MSKEEIPQEVYQLHEEQDAAGQPTTSVDESPDKAPQPYGIVADILKQQQPPEAPSSIL
jgi:hypothetical protein